TTRYKDLLLWDADGRYNERRLYYLNNERRRIQRANESIEERFEIRSEKEDIICIKMFIIPAYMDDQRVDTEERCLLYE
ncbi:hypothetical protein AVEN_266255-1, partial [Araneus ventricosus]